MKSRLSGPIGCSRSARLCCFTIIPLLGLLLAPRLTGAESLPAWPLRQGEALSAAMAGTWTRLADGEPIALAAGDATDRLAVGAYRRSTDGRCLLVRDGDDAGAHARSLIGLRTITAAEADLRIPLAERLVAVDHLTLVILAWRLADELPWPWVGYEQGMLGLPRLLQRHDPDAAGFRFDQATGAYQDAAGEAVAIGPEGVQPGDLVTAGPDRDEEARWGLVGILVADHGRLGVLDPEDRVVTCQGPGGGLLARVEERALGHAAGPQTLHAFRRLPERIDGAPAGGSRPLDPDNPIWGLPRERQLLALAGMVIIVLVLLRNIRRHRKGQKK